MRKQSSLLLKVRELLDEARPHAPLVLRLGISLVLLWFGINQLINPESFLGYIPDWLYPHGSAMMHEHPLQLMHNIPDFSVHFLIMGNGIFETVLGLLLLLGRFVRTSALLVFLHLIGIMIGLGYNDVAVRDFGLAMAALSLFLRGSGDEE